jgi:hypothetical protein
MAPFVKLLEDEEDRVRRKTTEIFSKLANYGELQLDIIVAELIQMPSRVS